MTTDSAPTDLRRLIGALQRFGLDLAGVPGDTDPGALANLVDVAAKNWKAGRVRAARHLWRHFRVRATMRLSVQATPDRARVKL